jgi:hypothetical protein
MLQLTKLHVVLVCCMAGVGLWCISVDPDRTIFISCSRAYRQINMGRFNCNQRSGFVLKPPMLRNKEKVFNPFNNLVLDQVVAVDVTVTVISAQVLFWHHIVDHLRLMNDALL